jgi:type IV secretory pathway VirB2 component (pilin)
MDCAAAMASEHDVDILTGAGGARNRWLLRMMHGGNAKTAAIAAIAFTLGYMWGKGDSNRW